MEHKTTLNPAKTQKPLEEQVRKPQAGAQLAQTNKTNKGFLSRPHTCGS